MLPSFLIMFRESLEVSLVVGIILSFLIKTKQTKYNDTVYIGVISGIFVSLIVGYLFVALKAEFEGYVEQVFEGVTMLVGAALITTMIFWMMKQRKLSEQLHAKLSQHIETANVVGLFLLAFVSVLREGIETVIFLSAASNLTNGLSLVGICLGLGLAILLGYLIFVMSIKIKIKYFFTFTSVLLILFAAGLVSYGVHELIEAGLINPVVENIYDINHILSDKSDLGLILKGLFGYNGNPALVETISYFAYITFVAVCWNLKYFKK